MTMFMDKLLIIINVLIPNIFTIPSVLLVSIKSKVLMESKMSGYEFATEFSDDNVMILFLNVNVVDKFMFCCVVVMIISSSMNMIKHCSEYDILPVISDIGWEKLEMSNDSIF